MCPTSLMRFCRAWRPSCGWTWKSPPPAVVAAAVRAGAVPMRRAPVVACPVGKGRANQQLRGPQRANDAAFYRAICQIRLLDYAETDRALSLLKLDQVGLDELWRLSVTCEEGRRIDIAIKVLEHIESRDAGYRGVAAKAAR